MALRQSAYPLQLAPRMQEPGDIFPSAAQAGALLLAHLLLQYLIGALLYDLRRTIDLSQPELNALAVVLATGLLLVPVMHLRQMSFSTLLHASKSGGLATFVLLVPPVLLVVPAVLLADFALMAILHHVFPLSLWEEQAFNSMVADNLAAVIATCVLAPVLEEMLFRGVLLSAFLKRYERWAAISYSALFFGAAHLNIYQFFLAFWLGLALGWLFERSRSLIPCIALHAGVNISVTVLARSEQNSQPLSLSQIPPSVWAASIAAGTVGVWLLRRVLSNRSTKAA